MSGVGKSLITAGLCRILKQDGFDPAPFKSQNMALNSFITADGCEIGRAQAMQAFASGLEPEAAMNPILLKPSDDTGSQVIVNGHPIGNMSAREYFAYKTKLIPDIMKAFESLESRHDPIIIEGAGSPAEINLKENDIVNMGLAKILDAPVLLAADIDRGGVFAQLYGTVMLLEAGERRRIKGFIINKFRGDPSLLDSGIQAIEEKTGIPVAGVIPYIRDLQLEDEDSLSERLDAPCNDSAAIKIAVIRLSRMSNFSDLDPFLQNKDVSVFFTADPDELKKADLVIIPGTKNTIEDMALLQSTGAADALRALKGSTPIFGICGGYQLLGESIEDPDHVESGGFAEGLGFLPVKTVMYAEKCQRQTEGILDNEIKGIFHTLSGRCYEGYEIHAGRSFSAASAASPLPVIFSTDQDVYGTYIHGIFDRAEIAVSVLDSLASRKGVSLNLTDQTDQRILRGSRYDLLASTLRSSLDLGLIHDML